MTDYTDLIARLRGLSSAARNPLIVADPLEHAADEALAAIAALQADIAALHKRQHEVECLATERLRETVALTVERDALRRAIINRLHSYNEDTGEDFCGCAACAPLFAAITAPTTGC